MEKPLPLPMCLFHISQHATILEAIDFLFRPSFTPSPSPLSGRTKQTSTQGSKQKPKTP
jgi:hypothetical protein